MSTPPPTQRRTRSNRTGRLALAAVATLAAVALAGACSDDDETLDAAACDAYADIGAAFLGDPSTVPDLLADLEAAVPEADRDDVSAYAAGLNAMFEGDEEAAATEEFRDARAAVGDRVFQGCEVAERVEVDGIDYGFDGLPETIAAGRIAIRFTNATDAGEAHEIFVARKADGVTETLDELLAMDEDELFSKLVPTAVVFADDPGGEATVLADLEAGDYVAVCFIPTVDGGVPHAMEGMATTFTVA